MVRAQAVVVAREKFPQWNCTNTRERDREREEKD